MSAPLAWLFADTDAVEEVRTLAADSGVRVETFDIVATAARRYAGAPPALLLFAHRNLTLAERAFLELYRTAPGFAGGDHPPSLLCKGQDANTAYDLVKAGRVRRLRGVPPALRSAPARHEHPPSYRRAAS